MNAQTAITNLDNDTRNELRNAYYAIGDTLPNMVKRLQTAAYSDPTNAALWHEFQTFNNMLATFNNSDIGRIL